MCPQPVCTPAWHIVGAQGRKGVRREEGGGGRKAGIREVGEAAAWLSLHTTGHPVLRLGLAEAPWPLNQRERAHLWASGPWAETPSGGAGAALSSPPAPFSLLLLKMSTSYLARIFPDLENSIKQLSNT